MVSIQPHLMGYREPTDRFLRGSDGAESCGKESTEGEAEGLGTMNDNALGTGRSWGRTQADQNPSVI